MVHAPLPAQFPQIFIKSDGKTGGVAGAKRCGLFYQGPDHVPIKNVRLELHQEFVLNHPAVGTQRLQLLAGIKFHGFEYFAALRSKRGC